MDGYHADSEFSWCLVPYDIAWTQPSSYGSRTFILQTKKPALAKLSDPESQAVRSGLYMYPSGSAVPRIYLALISLQPPYPQHYK
jgi:hypothetical protein